MAVDRVATSTQSAYMSSQMMKKEVEVSNLTTQVSTGQKSTSYADYDDDTMAMESARGVVNRTTAYQTATTLADTQCELQDSLLDQLSSIASDLKDDISNAVATGDGTTLSDDCSDIFDQVEAILNYQDSNGNYVFGGGNDTTEPFTLDSFDDLVSLSSSSALTDSTDADYVFQNGSTIKSVKVSDSQTIDYGVLASDIGSDIMSTLKEIGDYINTNGDFSSTITTDQSTFLSDEITSARDAYQSINYIEANNGNAYNQIEDAADTQTTMIDLYSGFLSDIQDVDMSEAATNLSNAQTALQAVVMVTSSLNDVSLLDYLS